MSSVSVNWRRSTGDAADVRPENLTHQKKGERKKSYIYVIKGRRRSLSTKGHGEYTAHTHTHSRYTECEQQQLYSPPVLSLMRAGAVSEGADRGAKQEEQEGTRSRDEWGGIKSPSRRVSIASACEWVSVSE